MNQPKLSNVKVGDHLYALDIGRCEVVTLNPEEDYICLKSLDKKDATGLELFRDCRFDGRYCTEDETPMVYLSEPLILELSEDQYANLGPLASLFMSAKDEDDSDIV